VFPYLSLEKLTNLYKNFKNNIFEKSKVILNDSIASLKSIHIYWGQGKNKLLDVGCGSGIFANLATKKNWSVTGVELSESLIRTLRTTAQFRVIQGNILNINIQDKFDVVTLNQVIEHFPKPKLLIKRCYSLLRPGGYLYIATPNISSLNAKIKKDKFEYLIPPEHLSYFNIQTLSYLLHNQGFKILKYKTWSYPVDLAGLIKCLIKRKSSSRNKQNYEIKSNADNENIIKRIKYLIFDRLFCGLFYNILNINYQGTMIEFIAQKQ